MGESPLSTCLKKYITVSSKEAAEMSVNILNYKGKSLVRLSSSTQAPVLSCLLRKLP